MQISAALFGFAVACLLSLGFTPLVQRLAQRRNLWDQPGPRKIHTTARPHIGGLAMVAALVLTLVALSLTFRDLPPAFTSLVRGLVMAGTLVAVLGLIDDMQGSRPWKKLATQAVALAMLQTYADVLGWQTLVTASLGLKIVAAVLTTGWLLGLTNAMNLIDGLDGLATGTAAIGGLGTAILAWILGEPAIALIAATLVGCALGFLRSNAPPAKIFMGDTGSMFLGFVLAALGACLFWRQPSTTTALGLLFLHWVPCLDALLTLVRRLVTKVSIFEPDHGHVHHRLLDLGLSQRHAGLSLWALSTLGAVAGLQIVLGKPLWAWSGAILTATLPLAFILRSSQVRASLRGAPLDPAAAGQDAPLTAHLTGERAA